MMHELPEIPLTPIDLINRRAAATGSQRYAVAAGGAGYNGHNVVVQFKTRTVYGNLWVAEYYYGEPVRLGRGRLEHCLQEARREYDKGLRGTTVMITEHAEAPESLEEQRRLIAAIGGVPRQRYVPGEKPAYWTGTHEAVSDALSYCGSSGRELLVFAKGYTGSIESWPSAREAWFKRYYDERYPQAGAL